MSDELGLYIYIYIVTVFTHILLRVFRAWEWCQIPVQGWLDSFYFSCLITNALQVFAIPTFLCVAQLIVRMSEKPVRTE